MKKILLLAVALLGTVLLQAQGIYNLWGMAPTGGSSDLGVIFKTDSRGDNFRLQHEFSILNPGANPGFTAPAEFNGKFYGMTFGGGSDNLGVIFEWDPATNIYSKKLDFNDNNGSFPHGSLTLKNGKFYGMTSGGGAYGAGVIFEWNPATNLYATKIELDGVRGSHPSGSMVWNAGRLYGMTCNGGNSNGGIIFEWDPVANVFAKKIDLDPTIGNNPTGDLSFWNGRFYGMTSMGGNNDAGVIFEWDPSTNVYTKKIDLSISIGSNPLGSLTVYNGKLYGITSRGGINDAGVVFEWDPASNIYTKKIDLEFSTGSNPQGSLTLVNGKFYGLGTEGGTNFAGVIFEWDPATNTYSKKFDFGLTDGIGPRGSLTFRNGNFYGLSYGGGCTSGVIFQWTPTSNSFTKKIDLNLNNGSQPFGALALQNGRLYGMSFYGGIYDDMGVIFEWNPATAQYAKRVDLQGGNRHPMGSLTWSNGKFYGMTMAIDGSIFEWDTSSNAARQLHQFNFIDGSTPLGNLTEIDGMLYGMTSDGGGYPRENIQGVLFRWSAVFGYQKLLNFTGPNGSRPNGSLAVNNGKLYGITPGGGVNNMGVIFEWDPATSRYTKKYDFNGSDGGNPSGSLTFFNGSFYGITTGGGANGKGVIFQWNPSTNSYQKKHDFDGINGGSPSAGLTLNNGKFYGVAGEGLNGKGVIFEWDPVSNVYTKKKDFNGADGSGANGLTVAAAPVSNGVPGSCRIFPSVIINSNNNNQWVAITDEDGNAVAEIKANGNNLGVVTASMFINNGPVRQDGTGRLYLYRTITIKPQFPQKSSIDIRLYIKGSEFLALKNAHNSFGQTAGINSINDVGIFKINGGCQPAVATVSNLINTSGAAWENDYVLSASINSFTTFCFASKNPCAAPVITQVSASQATLSPADHQMKNVTVNYSATGNCWPISSSLTVTSNEPVSGTGAADLCPDWIVIDDHHLQLRAERSDRGTGRIYTITVTSKNAFGTTCRKTLKITVPYQQPASLSRVINDEHKTGDLLNCRVIPNPSSQYFNLTVETASAEKIEATLFDISGKIMSNLHPVKNQSRRFGDGLKPGVYLVKITQGGQQQLIRVIKQ